MYVKKEIHVPLIVRLDYMRAGTLVKFKQINDHLLIKCLYGEATGFEVYMVRTKRVEVFPFVDIGNISGGLFKEGRWEA